MATFKIFSKRLAYQLAEKGHVILDKEPNHKKKGFLVYIFRDTQQLHNDLTELTRN